MVLHNKILEEIDEIKGKYPDSRSCLLPTLYLFQREYGWLSPEALEAVGDILKVPKATVKGVSTFYIMFNHKPMGRHLIQVCTNVACMIMGGERLLGVLEGHYGLRPNSTTADGRFSLVVMECIGGCDNAPAILIDTDFYGRITGETLIGVLEKYK
jgi:NADH-quinone oxidoreductase subunit E